MVVLGSRWPGWKLIKISDWHRVSAKIFWSLNSSWFKFLSFDGFLTRLPLTWLVVFNPRVTWGFIRLLGPYSQPICHWDMSSQLSNFDMMPQCTSLPFVVSTIKIRDAKYTRDKGPVLIRHWVRSAIKCTHRNIAILKNSIHTLNVCYI